MTERLQSPASDGGDARGRSGSCRSGRPNRGRGRGHGRGRGQGGRARGSDDTKSNTQSTCATTLGTTNTTSLEVVVNDKIPSSTNLVAQRPSKNGRGHGTGVTTRGGDAKDNDDDNDDNDDDNHFSTTANNDTTGTSNQARGSGRGRGRGRGGERGAGRGGERARGRGRGTGRGKDGGRGTEGGENTKKGNNGVSNIPNHHNSKERLTTAQPNVANPSNDSNVDKQESKINNKASKKKKKLAINPPNSKTESITNDIQTISKSETKKEEKKVNSKKNDDSKQGINHKSPTVPLNQSQQTSDINYGRGQKITIFHVAEKPSIAQAIANGLSKGNPIFKKKSLPVHEFMDPSFPKAPHAAEVLHKVSSVAGHVFSVDFPTKFQSWESVDPLELFQAPIVRKPCKGSVVKHLQDEAKGCDFIVLWMDCDRYVLFCPKYTFSCRHKQYFYSLTIFPVVSL